ncbi:hypothetical protein EVAR_44496_1 [Eumeta japonica]|uniref:Uncharacterized protein n=1 Tax=Eumeta variegata TaxID=151549 RepID=A0A4C1WKZ7_EUMVA|nr:hypothetical protein EVAR_44496_1 [Eumeta japonica]
MDGHDENDSVFAILTGNPKNPAKFLYKRDVRQGDSLSIILLGHLRIYDKETRLEEWGLNIDGKYLRHFCFADDAVLLLDSRIQFITLQSFCLCTNEKDRRHILDKRSSRWGALAIFGGGLHPRRAARDAALRHHLSDLWEAAKTSRAPGAGHPTNASESVAGESRYMLLSKNKLVGMQFRAVAAWPSAGRPPFRGGRNGFSKSMNTAAGRSVC